MSKTRIASIDFLRGMVMILMALDHVRDYFHYDAFFFDPTDLTQTNPWLFLTRFVTHFCAPVFVFLAGTSAFFVGQRRSKKELSVWLLKRGFWLIFAEITIIKFGWFFELDFSVIALIVIWVLGVGMIFLAAFIHLPKTVVMTICVIGVLGHNLLDGLQPESWTGLWTLLHVQDIIPLGSTTLFIGYPLIPWIFLMPLGYHFGNLYLPEVTPAVRKRQLQLLGFGSIALFVLLRTTNFYGDPYLWSVQERPIFSLMSFFNVSKYPPSLLYLLITMGPSILLLWIVENWKGKWYDRVVVIGRVPMFYYIIHIYLIHLLGVFAAALSGFDPSIMLIDVWVTFDPGLKGYGFSLWVVYLVWIVVVVGLYPICKQYYLYKINHREKWWLSYL